MEWMKTLCKDHRLDVYQLSSAALDFLSLDPFAKQVKTFRFPQRAVLDRRPTPLSLVLVLVDLFRLQELARRVGLLINAENYDLAFVHHCRFTQTPMLGAYLNVPSVYFCQEPFRSLYEPQIEWVQVNPGLRYALAKDASSVFRGVLAPLLRRIERKSIRSYDRILTNSYYSQQYISRTLGIHAAVNYLGVDHDTFKPLKLRKQRWVLSVGALSPRKGHDFIIQALSRIPANHRPILVIAYDRGSRGAREILQTLASRLGVELIFLQGISTASEMAELYSAALVTAYAPILEPLGLVPLESMSCCTPVVGVREGGVQETILDGEVGFLTNRNLDEFAERIELLIMDPKRRERMGLMGREYVLQGWTWGLSTERLLQRFYETIRSSREHPSSMKR